jgi:hypothetical protein
LNQKLQLEAIYAQNIAQGRQLNAEIETACATALKNAGADPQKATVDREKLQIVAKPPAPQKK